MKSIEKITKSKSKLKKKRLKSVQDAIPIQRVYKDGIFLAGGLYSKMWTFSDINYKVADDNNKHSMFQDYCKILNSLPLNAEAQIIVNNRSINRDEFQKVISLENVDERLLTLGTEIKDIIMDKIDEGNDITQEKYIVISVQAKKYDEAKTTLNRIESDFMATFGKLASRITPITAIERLQILHDFYIGNHEYTLPLDFERYSKAGKDVLDYIAPESMQFFNKHFTMGEKFGRTIYLKDYAAYISDKIVMDLTDMPKNMMYSMSLVPVATDVAIRMLETIKLGLEKNLTDWQNNQNKNNNFSAQPPAQIIDPIKDITELISDIKTRDQHIMFANVSIVLLADSLEELDADTETIFSKVRGGSCQFATLFAQQEKGLNTVLPYGTRYLESDMRTLKTESVAAFMPFKVQEVRDDGGLYYGVNAVSHNVILCNRKNLINGNGWILGISGSGKSVFAKFEGILNAIFNSDDDIIIMDPESEYGKMVEMLGGQKIVISGSSNNHINAMEIVRDSDDGENPVSAKAQFIMSIYEQISKKDSVTAQERSIIDRAVSEILRPYILGISDVMPTLVDLYELIKTYPETEAKTIALSLEMYVNGNLDVFAKETNVDINNRIVCFDIMELGDTLKPVGLLVMLDNIMNRVISNRRKGKYTHIYIDEAHLFFKNEFSSEFLARAWKRFRKYGGLITGITQNISEVLNSDTARLMIANSEFIIMLNQSADDQRLLSNLLKISPEQLAFINNSPVGQGIMRIGANIIPFQNRFPTNTQLYKLISTKPGENN
ncbi:MAG: VirB4-like conjugal transfer ATPase, CD1110 family [Candidatus Gastranaerophilaceae bacterium]